MQELQIKTQVIEFEKEVWYSPCQHKTYIAGLPPGFEGGFGPGVKTYILELKNTGDTTEPKITGLLANHDIDISASSVHRFLTDDKQGFHKEAEDAIQAGIQCGPFTHIDDTGTRYNGENWHTFVLCNEYFTGYKTVKKKDRLSVLSILQFGNPQSYRSGYPP